MLDSQFQYYFIIFLYLSYLFFNLNPIGFSPIIRFIGFITQYVNIFQFKSIETIDYTIINY